MTMFHDVGDFHRKFDLLTTHQGSAYTMSPGREAEAPRDLDAETLEYRIKFMMEELEEYIEGAREGDHAKMFDALIDLVYVALGTAHMQNYPWMRGWALVQFANMNKVRAQTAADSKRGTTLDVVKPLGWEPPNIYGVLRNYGWDGTCTPVELNLGDDK